ncbi:hypothetical protein Hanom_Chr14g01300981 [Helianthus anomalus]
MLYLARDLLNLSIISCCYKFKVGYCCLMLMFTSLVLVVKVTLSSSHVLSFGLGSEFLELCDSLFSDFVLILHYVITSWLQHC